MPNTGHAGNRLTQWIRRIARIWSVVILGITLVMIIASLGRAGAGQIVRGICGFALQEVGECRQCKLVTEERAEERQEAREALFREVEEILEQAGD